MAHPRLSGTERGKDGAPSALELMPPKSRQNGLFAGEVVDGDGVFEERVIAGDDGDAAFGDEIALAVGVGVEADGGAFGKMDITIDDGTADAAVASDADVGEENALVNFGIRVDADIGRENAIFNAAAGDDASIGNDGVEGGASAAGFGEDEFGRGILALMGADGPLFIVEVENRRDGDDVHIGFVVSLDRANVAPIQSFLLVLVDEVVGIDAVVVDHPGQNVFAKIVGGFGIFGVFEEDGDEDVGIEDVNAHGCRDFFWIDGRA